MYIQRKLLGDLAHFDVNTDQCFKKYWKKKKILIPCTCIDLDIFSPTLDHFWPHVLPADHTALGRNQSQAATASPSACIIVIIIMLHIGFHSLLLFLKHALELSNNAIKITP